jgi:vacuole morphology and inheritance protein 14
VPIPRVATLQVDSSKTTDAATTSSIVLPSRPASPSSAASITGQAQQQSPISAEKSYALDYSATVNALTIQFLSEHEETRVAALKWLIMLHQKSPKVTNTYLESVLNSIAVQILAMDDGTFPALLKTLSDPSEEVRIVHLIGL